MISKKVYTSPTLKTQVIELGVFGSYNTPHRSQSDPVDPIIDRNFRME